MTCPISMIHTFFDVTKLETLMASLPEPNTSLYFVPSYVHTLFTIGILIASVQKSLVRATPSGEPLKSFLPTN